MDERLSRFKMMIFWGIVELIACLGLKRDLDGAWLYLVAIPIGLMFLLSIWSYVQAVRRNPPLPGAVHDG